MLIYELHPPSVFPPQDLDMNARGVARMRALSSVLKALPKAEHNKLVAVASPRAAPIEQWGPVLSDYPEVVRARIRSLQTGDLVLFSTKVGVWSGNVIQFISNSPWNHVAVVVRGEMTLEEEQDQHVPGYCHLKKMYVPRGQYKFRVDNEGTPHLLEASWHGVHLYPDLENRLVEHANYEGYSTIALRALQGVDRTDPYMQRIEKFVSRVRGTAYEASTWTTSDTAAHLPCPKP